MDRRRVLGGAANLAALVVLIIAAVLLAANLPSAPSGDTQRPAALASTPADATPTLELATEQPELTPTPPSNDPLPTERSNPVPTPFAYTNPDGPPSGDYPADGYPFVEQARALPNFSGIWVDENQRDFHVAVTKDIEAAIEALAPGIPRGITVYFHLHDYSYSELDELSSAIIGDRDELLTKGIVVSFAGVGEVEGRVEIGISPLTPETLEYMQRRYMGPIDYEAGGVSALRRFDPPVRAVHLIALRDGDDVGLMTCGRRPFPETALSSAPVDLNAISPEIRRYAGEPGDICGDLRRSRFPFLDSRREGRLRCNLPGQPR